MSTVLSTRERRTWADDAIRLRCQYVLRIPLAGWPEPALGPGAVVRVRARGHIRNGVIERTTRTGTYVVAVVTPSNPNYVSRVTVKPRIGPEAV